MEKAPHAPREGLSVNARLLRGGLKLPGAGQRRVFRPAGISIFDYPHAIASACRLVANNFHKLPSGQGFTQFLLPRA